MSSGAHHRHRSSCRALRSIACTGTRPITSCRWEDRHRSLCRHPCRHGQAEQGGDRPAGDEHARARLRHRDRGRRAGAPTPCTAEEVQTIDAIASPDLPSRSADAADRREDRRAVGRIRPSEFRDRYEEALRALIDQKRKGKSVSKPSPQTTTPRSSTSWPRSRRPRCRRRAAAGAGSRRNQPAGGRHDGTQRPLPPAGPSPGNRAATRRSPHGPSARPEGDQGRDPRRSMPGHRHDIAPKDIEYAMAHADDMLADAICNVEQGSSEIEGEAVGSTFRLGNSQS